MKSILLTLSFCSLVFHGLNAQTEAEKKIKQEIWANPFPEFKSTKVPEKWNNESAVVLALRRDYIGDLAGVKRFYIEKVNVHFRIKLLDKAAVKDFSEISFNNKSIRTNLFGKASAYRIIGIKIIKTNGTEKEVDLSTAVKADAGSSKELKIPIPNLETGDIIDYFIALRDESQEMPDFGDEILLEGKYPIVTNTISFSLPRKINFYSAQYNGAPKLKQEIKDKDVVYTLKDEMREKAPDLLWNYEYRTSPHIRYKVTEKDVQPDPEKDAKSLLSRFSYNLSDIGFMIDFMDGNFKKEKDQRKIAQEIYYLLRNPIYMKAYFNIEQGEPLYADYPNDLFFFLVDKYLTKYKISHDLILVPAREYGPFPRLVNFGACDLIMKVNTTPPIYIPRPTPFGLPGDIPYVFEGMEGVPNTIPPGKNAVVKNIVLDSSTVAQNSTISKLAVLLHPEDNTKLNIKRSVVAKGHSKIYHQYQVFTNYDYLKEYDLPKYQVEKSHLLRDLIKDYNKEKVKFEQRLAQDYNDRDNRIKEELEKEMDVKVSDYKNLSIKSIGMWHTQPDTEYSDEYTLENLTKKAGPNLILELGRFIEKQTEIKEDQKKRDRDIYMSYPRSFEYEISFAIPEGYTVEGYENFNKKVESNLGGFVSSAKVEGRMLSIKARKYYNKNTYTAAEWPKLVNFLTSAVDFYNAKVLLKKQRL